MPVQLVFFDVDGTLIGPSGRVSDSLWPKLDRGRSRGLRMSVCTGRPSGGIASQVAARLDGETPHIFHGGGVARRVSRSSEGVLDHAPVLASAIRAEILTGLVKTARRRGLTLELYTPDAIFVDQLTPEAADHATLLGTTTQESDLLDVIDAELVVKAQWVLRDLPAVAAEMQASTVPGCHVAHGISPVMPDTAFLTITRKDSDKGGAVRWVCRSLGVELEDVAAVGDSPGDRSMLDVVGHPCVMASAPENMKQRYRVLGSVEQDGAAEVFDLVRSISDVP